MTKFEEEFNYLIELSGKVLIGQVDAEKFEENRVAFFEKYNTDQQQALPVVPWCVAEWYEEHKDDLDYSIYIFCTDFYKNTGCPGKEITKFENWFDNDSNQPIETLIRMKDGYTVEKPQLFYLKNKLTGFYLFRSFGGKYGEQHQLREDEDFKFTQQEIDSMQTGSYEQIKVPVENE